MPLVVILLKFFSLNFDCRAREISAVKSKPSTGLELVSQTPCGGSKLLAIPTLGAI